MTSNSTSPHLLRRAPAHPLPPQLLDGVTEALMSSPGAAARSEIICGLIHEMLDSVAWLDSSSSDHAELAALLQLVDVAEAHRIRMAGPTRPVPTAERGAS